ncbi:hypothetical protein [Thiospirillum jenense]|uniref:Uncharacterized protein n=1 Tax=Thiospirillum jenense TaxID=1653858 RepID=A0A839HBS1_9GAMM|nr:hypothetical protein [Thiospirillum jenense]MBB1126445.1 hypothetical protein [Thiospirillum jenense]
MRQRGNAYASFIIDAQVLYMLAKQSFLSIDDYLISEDGADCRHEYINGELYAMTGATEKMSSWLNNDVA